MASDGGSNRLGTGGATAVSTGLAFAAINFLGLGAMLTTHDAGDRAWLPVAAAGLLMLLVWGVFGELNGMYPTAAAIRLYLTRAVGERIALVITFTYLITILMVIAADAFIIGEAVTHVLHQPPDLSIAYVAGLLAVATGVNLRGIRVTGAVEAAATTTVVIGSVAVAVVALVRTPAVHPLSSGAMTTGDLVRMVVPALFLFTGFEWVTTTAEEVRRPSVVPRAMLAAVVVLLVSLSVFAVAMGHLLTADELGSAYPQLFVATHAAGSAGVTAMMAITAVTAVNTFNGGFLTASRFMYAVAREGKLPAFLARLNDRAVPTWPVLLLGAGSFALAVMVVLTRSFAAMVSVGAALEAGIYAVAAVCVLRLRRRHPDAPRPFRFRAGKPALYATAVVFGALCLGAAVTVDGHFSFVPAAVVLLSAGAATLYVRRFLPVFERREAERLAAARAARRALRSARAAGGVEPG